MGISTAFHSPQFLATLVSALVAGLFCVLRPEAVRTFAARRRPGVAARFRDAEAHRCFITFCGWALLALAAGSSLGALLLER
jgi:hypothetical protein